MTDFARKYAKFFDASSHGGTIGRVAKRTVFVDIRVFLWINGLVFGFLTRGICPVERIGIVTYFVPFEEDFDGKLELA